MKKIKILLFSILTICLFGVSANMFLANAEENSVSADMYLPASYLEYYLLKSPVDVATKDGVTAILENDKDHQSIIIYENELFTRYTSPEYSFGNINQIKFIGDKLILQDGLRPYIFDYKNNTYTEVKDSLDNYIPCTYFDFNDNYFITNYNSTINIYKVTITQDNFSLVKQPTQIISGTDNCIAINGNNDIFYFKESKLFVTNLTSITPKEYKCDEYSLSVSCASLKANNKFLYFSYSDGLGRFDIVNSKFKKVVNVDTTMVLGTLSSPKGLCFRGENILIVDSGLCAVEEFANTDDGLAFSGFAITASASAYNRLNNKAVDISIYDGKVSAFDSEKLLVITDNNNVKTYQNFYFDKELINLGFTPTHIASSGNIVLFTDSSRAKFFNTETKVISSINDNTDAYAFLNPIASSYINGYFYILATPNGNRKVVIKIDGDTFTPEEIFTRENINNSDLITVDIDGYVYVYSDKKVYKYTNEGVNRGIVDTFTLENLSIDIGVDLNGDLYSLTADNKVEYFSGKTKKIVPLAFSANLPIGIKANALAMNFDNEKIFFLFGGNGLVLTISDTENDNIKNISVPEDFKITDRTSKPITELKIFNVDNNANLFSVNATDTVFKYNGVTRSNGREYVFVGEIDNFYILAGDGVYLVKKDGATNVEFSTTSEINSGYVSTSVNLYYCPIFLPEYVLTNFTRLPKSTPLTINGKVNILDNGSEASFYFVTLTINNEVVSGYIPEKFNTDNVIEVFNVKQYAYKTLNAKKNAVSVFLDLEMKNLALSINTDTLVKATKINESVSLIEYEIDGTTTLGYVYNSAFLVSGKKAVTNSIIIIVVAVSVSATSIFFIFKKRKQI